MGRRASTDRAANRASSALARLRGWVQAGATLLTNVHLPNFLSGALYRGAGKTVCVPGLNCYSCPGATGACPIGAFQAVVGSSKFHFSYYITGTLILLGVLLGRFVCGFLCPFGWFQELLHRLPTKKLPTRRLRPLRYLKYAVLLVAVFLLPAFLTNDVGMGDPYFCKFLCPQGVLEGAVPLSLADSGIRAALGNLFAFKALLLVAIVVLSVLFYRPFCKWLCPLGAFYALLNRVSLLRMHVDEGRCVGCGRCAKVCKMDVDVRKAPNHPECIRCGMCVKSCPTAAVGYRYGFGCGSCGSGRSCKSGGSCGTGGACGRAAGVAGTEATAKTDVQQAQGRKPAMKTNRRQKERTTMGVMKKLQMKTNAGGQARRALTAALTATVVAAALSLVGCGEAGKAGGSTAGKDSATSAAAAATGSQATAGSQTAADSQTPALTYEELKAQETDILNEHNELWERVFLVMDKEAASQLGKGANYGDFLLQTIEGAKDRFTDDELATLRDGAERIRAIEDQIALLPPSAATGGDAATAGADGNSVVAGGAGTAGAGSEGAGSGDAAAAKPFPSFSGKDLEGNDVDNSLFAENAATVVNFWFSGCKPCVEELGDLNALNERLKQSGGAVVGINTDTLDGNEAMLDEARGLLAQKGATYRNVYFDSDSDAGRFALDITAFPTTCVVDRDGNIVGEPLLGSIDSPETMAELQKLIDKAIEADAMRG